MVEHVEYQGYDVFVPDNKDKTALLTAWIVAKNPTSSAELARTLATKIVFGLQYPQDLEAQLKTLKS